MFAIRAFPSCRSLPAALRRGIPAVAAILASAAGIPDPARAQFLPPTDTLYVGSSSSMEKGYLSFLNLNRDVPGPRAMAMGNTGLAVAGGVERMALNPAGLVDVTRWEVFSEFSFLSGSGDVSSFPELLSVGPGQVLETSDYRVSPGFRSGYRDVSVGIPLVLFGRRAALGLSYRRMSPSFQGDETRFEAVGPITNNIPATIGVDQSPEGSHDAITFGIARRMADFLDLGMNANFQSGTIERDLDIGASVFGQRQTGGGVLYEQDLEGFNVDLGGRVHAGALSLGGSLYLGHDLTFKKAQARIFPLPDIQSQDAEILYIEAEIPEHTLSVPTAIGLGAAYTIMDDRLTLAADFWSRPWEDAEITRQSLDPIYFFADPTDSSTFVFGGTQLGEGEETFNAGLPDGSSIQFGVEYVLKRTATTRVPVRAGFRKETLTISNVRIDAPYDDYTELVNDYWRYGVAGMTPPEGVDPAELEDQLRAVLEHQDLLFRGDGVDATVISLGMGLEIENFTIDVGLERTSFDVDRFFFQQFDPLIYPFATRTEESRSITRFSFATRMTF